jgi:hypothetical protein
MKKTRTPPELVEAEWETVVAAEEALNASFLRTLLVRSNEGRVVACGREESVARVIKELVPNRRASILDADHEIDVPMATHQVFMRSQPQRLTL